MRNEKLRQKKLARNKTKREHRNKVYDQRQKCERGSYRAYEREKEYNDYFNKLKNQLGL